MKDMKTNVERGKISIVIPTFNEEKDIQTCLKSISEQDYPKNLYEVIVVDNYSNDKTLDIVKSFTKKIKIIILHNKLKDAETSKMLGFKASNSEFFMYLDADMRLSDSKFLTKMLLPFRDDKKIAGNFVRFVVNKKHPALTRTLSYDEFQRDPIFEFFTIGIEKITILKEANYWICKCTEKKIPPQGLMIYRRELIFDYVKNRKQLIDNEIPAVLVKNKHVYFAYVPDTGVEHLLLRNLGELWRKRVRNLKRTYYPNVQSRNFKWINWKKDWPKIGIWLIYTHSIILPIFNSLYKAIKYNDLCFLNEPVLNLISTYSIIWGVLRNS